MHTNSSEKPPDTNLSARGLSAWQIRQVPACSITQKSRGLPKSAYFELAQLVECIIQFTIDALH